MASKQSYLSQLRFSEKLRNTVIAKYLTNTRLVVLLVILITVTGIYSFIKLPKVLNPDVKIPIVIVSTILPGAGPNDIESLVTIPIEDAVTGLQKIDTVTSSSQESASILTIQFLSGVDPEKARQDVQTAVSTVTDLPKDTTTPKVTKLDFQNTPVWSFNITGTGDPASLMQFSTDLTNQLKDVRTIDHVSTSGLDEQEIQVVIKPEAIATYNLNPQIVAGMIKSATNSYPAGSVKTEQSTYSLTIDPEVASIDDVRTLRVVLNGQSVPLGDVATVYLKSKPNQTPSYLATNASRAIKTVRFDVYKTSSASINQSIIDAKKVTDQMIKQYNGQFAIYSILDTQVEINRQFNELIRDLFITVVLVFITLFIFLGIRQAVVASLAIPMSFLITFTVMNLTGITLSFIAFFSLLLSLGLLVDDTVVVISAMTSYYRTGKFTPLETGLLVWRDFITAIFTSTITTVWAFLPLLLSTGIIGEFLRPVPIVVSSTLLGSFFVAMFITLPFIIILLTAYFPRRVVILVRILILSAVSVVAFNLLPKNNLKMLEFVAFLIAFFIAFQVRKQVRTLVKNFISRKKMLSQSGLSTKVSKGFISFEKIGQTYRKILDRILSSRQNRRKVIIMVVLFSLFSYILLPLGLVRNEFFPASDQNYLYVTIELPPGTNLEIADHEALNLLEQFRKMPDVHFVSANIGLGLNQTSGGYSSSSLNNILFSLVLPEKKYRKHSSIDIAESIRNKYKDYTKGKVSITEVSGGPPAGSDVQVKLFGDDLKVLDTYADIFINYLKTQPGLDNIDKSIKPGTSKVVFVPDKDKIAKAGLTIDAVGLWLRTYASGFSPASIKLSGDRNQSKDITIRTNSNDEYIDTISTLSIPVGSSLVSLESLGTLTIKPNPTVITREDGKRTISVSAGVRKGYSISLANQKFQDYLKKITLPEGYSWSTGGVNEENQKSVTSILTAMLLSFVLILVTMVLQFNSFRRALIVMLVIPLSISGVFIIFALFHIPLSFPALIGVLALFGIVVKNAILVVDKIMVNIQEGLEYKYAIIDGAESRLEPIALTSFAAILGLIPITLSNALWQGLGGAIIAGLLFSGTIMLFFIPVMYYIIFHQKK